MDIKNSKISFVILHYQNMEVTKECISYINKIKYEGSIDIIIVDNCSPNGTGQILKKYYKNNHRIHVLLNDKNEGFAKGNNLGYTFAKQKIKSNIIVHINSDLMITNSNFVNDVLSLVCIHKDVALIGPDVINLSNHHQNPLRMNAVSNSKLMEYYVKNSILQLLYRIPLINSIYLNSKYYRNKKMNLNNNWNSDYRNVVLHGSCIIFLEEWINEEEFAFVPITFLFMEEDILYDYARHKGYNLLYTKDIKVKHLEDASIDTAKFSNIEKQKFLMWHQKKSMQSMIKFRKYLKKENKDEITSTN